MTTNTNKRLSMVRELLHSEKYAVAGFLCALWDDDIITDYIREHRPIWLDWGEGITFMHLICTGIRHFMTISTRESGEQFYHWSQDTPEELREAFLDCTDLDDWRYEKLYRLAVHYLCTEEDGNFDEDLGHYVDVYNSELMHWLNCGRSCFVEEAEREFQVLHSGMGFFGLLQRAQYLELELVANIFLESLEDFAQEIESNIEFDQMFVHARDYDQDSNWMKGSGPELEMKY